MVEKTIEVRVRKLDYFLGNKNELGNTFIHLKIKLNFEKSL